MSQFNNGFLLATGARIDLREQIFDRDVSVDSFF